MTPNITMETPSFPDLTTIAPKNGNDVILGNATGYRGPSTTGIVMSTLLAIICIVGLIGNGLVIFVITRYTKMKTVTNMYILNLSVADFFFLLGLPFAMIVTIRHEWIGGAALCRIYYIQTCINWFTGTFTLVVMSADRFLAVCYPITSMKYRTPKYSLCAIGIIWLVSFVAMLPVVLFANLEAHPGRDSHTCNIIWPSENPLAGYRIFILYDFLLSFVAPVGLICVFYALLLCRLQSTGSQIRNADRRRSHRKVTKLVSLIIAVFIVCWLPYWSFQMFIVFRENPQERQLTVWQIFMNYTFTLLSYANSMFNPLLYAFTNENFKESFISAFKCAADPILGAGGRRWSEYVSGNNNSVMPPNNAEPRIPTKNVNGDHAAEFTEFTLLNSNSDSPGNSIKKGDEVAADEEKQKLTENNEDTKSD